MGCLGLPTRSRNEYTNIERNLASNSHPVTGKIQKRKLFIDKSGPRSTAQSAMLATTHEVKQWYKTSR